MHEHDTVEALMKALGVPEDLPKIVLVNGQHASENSLLKTSGFLVTQPVAGQPQNPAG